MSGKERAQEAWVSIPTEEEHRASLAPGAPAGQSLKTEQVCEWVFRFSGRLF